MTAVVSPVGRSGATAVPMISSRVWNRVVAGWPGACPAGFILLLVIQSTLGQTISTNPPLTRISDIWEIPMEQRAQPHRISTELLIYYMDQEWKNASGECRGVPTYLPISDCPIELRPRQRVALDGMVVPISERFLWDQTKIRILDENVPLIAEPVASLSARSKEIAAHLISVEGLIDRMYEDSTHITLTFINGETAATAYALKGTNAAPLKFHEGDFVRLKCVYCVQYDRDGNVSDISLLLPTLKDIEVIGSLVHDSRFDSPIIPSSGIREDTPTNLLHIAGTVHSYEPGHWLTIWDDVGQVSIQTVQSQPLQPGDRVEAVGYPFVNGVQRCLRSGLFRLDKSPARAAKEMIASNTLFLAERIRNLTREESSRHPKALLKGIVTWTHPRSPFAFIQDASGNVRVLNPRWDQPGTSKPGTIVTITGDVVEGDFVPAITNATIIRAGYWNLNEGTFITLEQAMTGMEEGNWVAMRGYVRSITYTNGLARLNLSTSTGDFNAWTPATPEIGYMEGSIIRVCGVCAATANDNHQLTGIEIWAPELKYFKVEESKPDDLFALEMRPLASLRRFNVERALNRRLRTYGTVILHEPGRYVYVQDGHDGIMALSEQKDVLKPGDRVELVGFPGNEGRQFLLREASYRRVAEGDQPAPIALALKDLHEVNADLAGLLACGQGNLLNTVINAGETTLHIHSDDASFEARLTGAPGILDRIAAIQQGSKVSISGVYEIQMDEYGRPRSFLLHMRSPEDVQVLQSPPWWTFARLVWLLLGLLVALSVGIVWTILISRKNTQLRQAQIDLQEANDQLEERVEVRTYELREQVTAKERAHAELAQTQQRLILASRQAGMAEIATGVLHNVGNVLNSVNVSMGLLGERVRQCRVEFVGKTAALLQQHRDDIGSFLTEDPKGRTLPNYLEQLGQSLERDKHFIHTELELLNKNVDHIKIIVAMQQSHAKSGGIIEEVDPRDLIEDALKVNGTALERHNIAVERLYHPAPQIAVDRHKVLQILINLISNAKWALDSLPDNKKITVELCTTEAKRIRIQVTDNGRGIAPENIGRIFSQGFTTRKDGHGFGLHSGANAAHELGGSLTVRSDGNDKGATFTLELPRLKPIADDKAAVATDSIQA